MGENKDAKGLHDEILMRKVTQVEVRPAKLDDALSL